MDEQTSRLLLSVLCRLAATLRLYWPDDADTGQSIPASSEKRFGPFTGGSVVVVNIDRVCRITTSKDERAEALVNNTAVPATAPTYGIGNHVYVIRPGPARYLFIHNTDAANACVASAVRGDTDEHVRY